jgi:adhesin/invasin
MQIKQVLAVFICTLSFTVSTKVFAQSQVKSAAEGAANSAISKVTSAGTAITKDFLSTLFPTVEVGVSSGLSNSVTGGILVVAPLSDPKNIYNTVFMQGSFFINHDDVYRKTINIGIGDRILTMDKKLLLGANVFYDQEFPYDHKRGSIGLEARSSAGELNANKYYRLSTWNGGYNGIQEKALSGQDIELGVPLPYMNWAKVYAKRFKHEAAGTSPDIKGDDLSLRANLPFGLSIEGGRRHYSTNGISDVDFVRLTWNSNPPTDEKPLTISNEAYTLTSMETHRYDKVRRENIIQKQKNTGQFKITGF